jgi:RNA polymerase sigma-70 factor (ECF subfamily)
MRAHSNERPRKFPRRDVAHPGTNPRHHGFPFTMEAANTSQQRMGPDFRTEALRWLPQVSRYARLLTRNQSDADDLTQETFLRAYQSWSTFRPGSDCRRWLFAICRHAFLRDRDRSRRVVAVEDADADVRATAELYWRAAASGMGDLFDRMDIGPALERALGAMAPEFREAVILVDVEDYSYAEAALVVGVPVGTIRSRLFRARRLLQEHLIDHARDLGFGVPRRTDNTPGAVA